MTRSQQYLVLAWCLLRRSKATLRETIKNIKEKKKTASIHAVAGRGSHIHCLAGTVMSLCIMASGNWTLHLVLAGLPVAAARTQASKGIPFFQFTIVPSALNDYKHCLSGASTSAKVPTAQHQLTCTVPVTNLVFLREQGLAPPPHLHSTIPYVPTRLPWERIEAVCTLHVVVLLYSKKTNIRSLFFFPLFLSSFLRPSNSPLRPAFSSSSFDILILLFLLFVCSARLMQPRAAYRRRRYSYQGVPAST